MSISTLNFWRQMILSGSFFRLASLIRSTTRFLCQRGESFVAVKAWMPVSFLRIGSELVKRVGTVDFVDGLTGS